ncbi:TPR-like protein [Anaeromyces robustus]|uniref:TPR-like protein n=1 Tax=Anaeromyces robustus TaxID=1754192 RepID=A0A1Y1XFI0_9FUNG|nr:TPR-like protein [Anaeromyces robustus]|eukprot:ORX84134.1 TPR-like protein [Anaeromyces robustus]
MSVKSLLKQAKKYIASGEYEDARDQCNYILELENDNYTALTFLGLAEFNLGEYNDSIKHYKKAIELDSSLPMPFQGLANLYEKQNMHNELIDVLKQLREKFKSIPEKFLQTTNRIITAYENLEDNDKLINELQTFLPSSEYYNIIKDLDIPKPLEIIKRIETIYEKSDEHYYNSELKKRRYRIDSEPYPILKIKIENEMIEKSKLIPIYEQHLELEKDNKVLEKYITLLKKKIDIKQVDNIQDSYKKEISLCEDVLNNDLDIPIAYEVLINDKDNKIDNYDIELFNKYLKVSKEDDILSEVIKLYIEWKEQNNDSSIFEKLTKLNTDDCKLIFPFYFQAYIGYINGNYQYSENLARYTKDIITATEEKYQKTYNNIKVDVDLILANSLIELEKSKYVEALSIYKSILKEEPENPEAFLGLGVLLIKGFNKTEEGLKSLLKADSYNPNNWKILMEIGWSYFLKEDYDNAKKYLEKSLELKADYLNNYRMARVYFKLNDYDTGFKYLISSMRINQNFNENYCLLGDYFCVKNNIIKAKQSYRKAHYLNNADEVAGKKLVELLIKDKDDTVEAIEVCNTILKENLRCLWAWKYISNLYYIMGNYQNAITSFQSLLRIDINDYNSWFGLALCYKLNGHYTPALKAFTRASEIKSDSACTYYEIASIQQIIGMYNEAKANYAQAIKLDPDYVLALYGLGSCFYDHSQSYIENSEFGQAAENLKKSLSIAYKGICTHPEIQSWWKLINNGCCSMKYINKYVWVCYPIIYSIYIKVKELMKENKLNSWSLISSLEEEYSKLIDDKRSAYDENLKENNELSTDIVFFMTTVIFQYSILINNFEDNSILAEYLHNLSLNIYLIYESRTQNKYIDNEMTKNNEKILNIAIKLLKTAIKLVPNNEYYWNSMGIYLINQPKYSQHSFIKGLNINPKSSTIWSNLGFLYLINNDLELANRSFSNAQTLNPNNSYSWIGQAFIAKQMNNSESFELYQHANELSSSSYFETNYYYTLNYYDELKKQNLEFQLSKYSELTFTANKSIELSYKNPYAFNLMGLIQERQKQYDDAIQHFDKSIDLLKNIKTKDQVLIERSILKVKINKFRVLCQNCQFEEGISLFNELLQYEENMDLKCFVHINLIGGICYCYQKKYEESVKYLENAYNKCDDEWKELKNKITLTMAQVYYMTGSDECIEYSKQQLLKCVNNTPDYLPALFSLCSLGMVKNDLVLASSAAVEMLKIPVEDMGLLDIDRDHLLCSLFVSQGNAKEGKAILSKAIYRYPYNAQKWIKLSQFINTYYSSKSHESFKLAKSANIILESNSIIDNKGDSIATTSEHELLVENFISFALSLLNDYQIESNEISFKQILKDIIRKAQKAIMVSPSRSEAWYALILGLKTKIDHVSSKEDIESAILSLALSKKVANMTRQSLDKVQMVGLDYPREETINVWSTISVADSFYQLGKLLNSIKNNVDSKVQQLIFPLLMKSNQYCQSIIDNVTYTTQMSMIYVIMGRILRIYGNLNDSLQWYKKALEINPKSLLILEEMAEFYKEYNLQSAAELCYRQILLSDTAHNINLIGLLRLWHLAMCSKQIDLAFEASNEVMKNKEVVSNTSYTPSVIAHALTLANKDNIKYAKKLLSNLEKSETIYLYPYLYWSLARVLQLDPKSQSSEDKALIQEYLQKEKEYQDKLFSF